MAKSESLAQNKKRQFSRQLVVITGAASGIGLELARAYREKGAEIVGIDLDLEKLKGSGVARNAYRADVSQESELMKVAAEILAQVGQPDVWVNNAGIAVLGAFEQMQPTDFNRVMSVNFGGVVNGTRAAMSIMKTPLRGTIVNIASVSGIVPAPYLSAYSAAKHAVVGFTRALRLELEHAASPLKLVLVSPGFVKTAIMPKEGEFRFPQWLEFMIDTPEKTAREILQGIQSGKDELEPTVNGRLMLAMYRVSPSLVAKTSRLLVAKSWKQLLGLSPIRK